MAFNNNITPGAPPLLWSNIYDAFTLINENFDSLVATVGDGSGLTPIDFSTLDTDVSPSTDNLYSLGASDYVWRAVYTGGYVVDTPDAANGVWIGAAHIKGIETHIDIPAGSTIDGELLIDPANTFFKIIDVDNGNSIEAQGFGDTVKFLSGDGISMSVDSASESITFTNEGILDVSAGIGISVSTTLGISTVTNTGVLSLTSTTALSSGRTAGAGININNSTGSGIKITNAGVISISSGVGITVSSDAASGDVTITNSAPAVNAYTQFEINGDSGNRIQADAVSDVLYINSGEGITLTKDTVTDTLTFTVNPVFDLKGSIFGDDSTKIVDAVENKIYSTFFGNLTGDVTGNADRSTVSDTLDITNTDGLTTVYYPTFVENRDVGQTVRADVDLSYRTDSNTLTAINFSGNLTGAVTGNIFTNLIDSADSSAITVTPAIIFSSDVFVENDLTVSQQITVQGSRVINLAQLQSVVAASADFTDFQARIAALV